MMLIERLPRKLLIFHYTYLILIFLVGKIGAQDNGGYGIRKMLSRNLKLAASFEQNTTMWPDYCYPSATEESSPHERKKRSFSTTEASEVVTSAMVNFTGSQTNKSSAMSSEDVEIDLSHLSDEFIKCQVWTIEEGCYEIMSNGSAYVPLYDKYYDISEHLVTNGNLLICPVDITDKMPPKFADALSIVSIIGLSISTTCIVLYMIMFIIMDTLRNLPGYCLFSLCVALIMGYSCFFAVPTFDEHKDCSYIGMMLLYFFLASFFWMNILSYDVWRSLRMATSKLRLTTHMWFRFGVYSAYCWGTPGLIVMSAVIVDSLGDVSEHYRLIFAKSTCWFTFKEALLVYFAGPFFILLFINLMFFIWSFIMITSASMKTAENRNVLWSRFCIFLRLAIIMGLTWIFGVIAAATNVSAFWYFYAIFNTTQGVLIFFSFSCGEKTRKAWRSKIQGRKTSSRPTQYSCNSQHLTSTV